MNITFEYSFGFYLFDEYYFQIFKLRLLFNEYYLEYSFEVIFFLNYLFEVY
jgi:hypothetical protein